MVDTDLFAVCASMLLAIPACLRDCIFSGEFIDFNSLLTKAMFSTRDHPTQFQSPSPKGVSKGVSEVSGT